MQYLTGGTVTFNRRKKTGDYEHADVKVELNFTFGDDDDVDREQLLAMAGMLAHKQAMTMLSWKDSPPTISQVAQSTTAKPVAAAAPAAPPDEAPKRKVGRPLGTGHPIKTALKAPVPAPADTDMFPESAPVADPLDMGDLETPTAPEITDKQLQAALGLAAGRLGDGQKVRKLVAQYVQPPNTARSMTQEMRAEFLVKLAELE